jgi:hypothetical protein
MRPEYLTLPAIARLLGISPPTIWRWARDSKLPTTVVRNDVTGTPCRVVAVSELERRYGSLTDERLRQAQQPPWTAPDKAKIRFSRAEVAALLKQRDETWLDAIADHLGTVPAALIPEEIT